MEERQVRLRDLESGGCTFKSPLDHLAGVVSW